MQRCVFLSLEDPAGFHIDDDRAIPAFAKTGWAVETIPWSRPEDWSRFDAAIVRSTWDYHKDPDRFFGVLEGIAAAGIPLFNDLDLMQWNAEKTYLADLATRGVQVVPTVYGKGFAPTDATHFTDILDSDRLVIKPVIGANAERTWRLDTTEAREAAAEAFRTEAFMVQIFVEAIQEEGEFSLFYFDGDYSHAIRKQPKSGDFRVQEEHGGRITSFKPTPSQMEAGLKVMAALDDTPLYARVDLIRSNDDADWWLMELELIEPSMYLRMDAGSPARFAAAFQQQIAAR
jgi:glutathione synthase/RimK-type ligase-like ATP-grasp enzyme